MTALLQIFHQCWWRNGFNWACYEEHCFTREGIFVEKVVRSARLVQAKSKENWAEGFTFMGELECRSQIVSSFAEKVLSFWHTGGFDHLRKGHSWFYPSSGMKIKSPKSQNFGQEKMIFFYYWCGLWALMRIWCASMRISKNRRMANPSVYALSKTLWSRFKF